MSPNPPERGTAPDEEAPPPSLRAYVRNIRRFTASDWLRYAAWMATVFGLFFATSAFLGFGVASGVDFPGYVFFIPTGAAMFASALAIDDIGHRTLYKEDLAKGEGAIHQMIIATAVSSVVALCLCYLHPEVFRMPALGLIFLSLFYSALDEAMHWVRYTRRGLDKVEMWAHFVAIAGHVLLIGCWWQWYQAGYPGVDATVAHLLS